jgi:hypothetical protein
MKYALPSNSRLTSSAIGWSTTTEFSDEQHAVVKGLAGDDVANGFFTFAVRSIYAGVARADAGRRLAGTIRAEPVPSRPSPG